MFYLCLLFVSNIFFEIGFVSTCGSDLSNVLLDNKYEFIDLTLPLDKSTEDESKRIEDVAVATSRGTHIEAPFNKDHDDVSVTDLPTEKLIVQLIVIDVSAKVHSDSKYVLNTKDLNTSLSSDIIYHMRSKPSLVVFTFGWSQYYFKDSSKYLGYEKATDSINLPAISYDVAKWLTFCESCKNVVGVGTDLPSINERGHNMSMPTRKTLIKAGFYVVEGLKWNHSLSNYQCIAIVSPMKIKEPKAPANVIAICPKDDINGAEDKKEHKREKREHKHHNMREQMMAIQNDNGHHHHQLSNTTELIESKMKNEKHHTMCKQIGDGMCGHNHQLSKVDEAHTNTLEHKGTHINDKVDIQGQDKNKTSLVNETRPHQIDENKNNIKDNNNQIKTNSHIEITKNVTQGNNKVNSASKKPVKTGEMEKKQPDLTSAPHNIIVGISNIKDKIKDFVIP